MKLSPIAEQALKSVQDCGVIRTRFDHDGFFELMEEGVVDFSTVGDDDDEDALDWRLI